MKRTQTLIALLLSALMLLSLCACGGKDGKKKDDRPTAQTSFEAMCEYAKRLEDAGNYEAAQRVYELLPDAMAGGAVNDMESAIADSDRGDVFAGKRSLDKWSGLIESVGEAK